MWALLLASMVVMLHQLAAEPGGSKESMRMALNGKQEIRPLAWNTFLGYAAESTQNDNTNSVGTPEKARWKLIDSCSLLGVIPCGNHSASLEGRCMAALQIVDIRRCEAWRGTGGAGPGRGRCPPGQAWINLAIDNDAVHKSTGWRADKSNSSQG